MERGAHACGGVWARRVAGLVCIALLPQVAVAETTTLVPVADGELVDEPTDGVFDGVEATDLAIDLESVGGGSPSTRRGALEFALGPIPVGATVESATLRLRVFGGTSPSRLDVHGYVADGVIDLADATRSDTLAGQTFWSSLPGTVQVDVTGYVGSLVSQGEPLLGLNLRTDESATNDSLRVGASELASDPPELEIVWDASGPPLAPYDWRWLPVLDDGYATDSPTDGVFDSLTTFGSGLIAQSTLSNFSSTFVTRRALLEVDVSGLATLGPILSAELTLDASQLKGGGTPPGFELFGYEGDGSLALADADLGNVLVDSVAVESLGPPIVFDVAGFLSSLQAGGAPVAGFNLRSDLDGVTSGPGHDEMITVGSRESTSPARMPPRLVVETSAAVAVPSLGVLPAVGLGLALAVVGASLARRRPPT